MILVTGASGNVGRALVEQLLAAGEPVRAVTRDPAAARLPDGVAVAGDPGRPETLAGALDGVGAVFVHPAAVGGATGDLLARARAAGATRAVLLSSAEVADEGEQTSFLAVRHHRLEQEVRGSGLEWTFVRPYEFATNLVQRWAGPIRATGVVEGAYAEAAAALVSERDVAAVAAVALRSPGHAGAAYRLTGPEVLTREQMVGVIGTAIGRPLTFREVPREQAAAGLLAHGLPEPVVRTVLDLEERSVGADVPVTADVERVTGRPALTLAEWAADHAADFR